MPRPTLSPFLILIPSLEEFEQAWIDACMRTGAAPGRLRYDCWTHGPNPDARPARSRHAADRKLDPGAPTGRAATGQHRVRVPGRGRHHAHDRQDRKSTRLNSSHPSISYALLRLK